LTVRLVDNNNFLDSLETTTNAEGEYTFYEYAEAGYSFKLKVSDPDSSANVGNFKNKIVDIGINSRIVNNKELQSDVLMKKK
jgi:hypothetical protein